MYNKFTTNLQQTNKKRVMLKLEVIKEILTELNWALGKTGRHAY